ncbi:leucine-rich repeat protein soc-2-like isoform X3 [Dreissena polymorpha]|uniref:leucine-rich repeat protein soc-2-like isoform X1 n=1 Tax=Dreissena polymorpha TaxID=45954 RepID=UPI0022651EA9|nr:leucine-rich repeat protein soc-2-like isoform X1 [Dreissena polymorpha]XP_052246454.1 leucine-rich repeat protein soc-2-like isoform X3 [Dreissena polymorpha]
MIRNSDFITKDKMIFSTIFTLLVARIINGENCPIIGVHKCACTVDKLTCDSQRLTAIPTFTSVGATMTSLELRNNSLSSIPGNSFAALNVSEVDLSNNEIRTINAGAFSGVTLSLKRLNLANNRLTSLPADIGVLTAISEIDLRWNPIPGFTPGSHGRGGTDGLSDEVMKQIGDSITTFKFGSSIVNSWPQSLSHLNRVKELVVAGVNIPYWPPSAFHGFERTLTKLTIENLPVGSVPYAIATLTHLEELHLDNLQYPFGDASLVSLPFAAIGGTLKVLSLKNDSLTTFPEGIQQLTSLNSLTLDGNHLEFVSDEAIKLLQVANVTMLSLKDCDLKRVPGAISDLKNLQELHLSNNLIRSIESTDLQNLFELRELDMSGNPLLYISDNSLCGLNSLLNFSLENTFLTEISRAFKNLRKLEHLSLVNAKIDCTCDMTWVKSWMDKCQVNEKHLEILGNCETINRDITDYANHRLTSCPGYNVDNQVFKCTGTCVEHVSV